MSLDNKIPSLSQVKSNDISTPWTNIIKRIQCRERKKKSKAISGTYIMSYKIETLEAEAHCQTSIMVQFKPL